MIAVLAGLLVLVSVYFLCFGIWAMIVCINTSEEEAE